MATEFLQVDQARIGAPEHPVLHGRDSLAFVLYGRLGLGRGPMTEGACRLSLTVASERARQKKQERKRRKREARRRALRSEADSDWSAPPPMSLTLKRFAEPLLDRLPDKDDAEDWKLVLSWAAMVWNGSDEEKLLDVGRGIFELMEWKEDVPEEIRRLRVRRESEFGWESRLVAEVEVEDRGDTMHIVAVSALA